MAEIPAEAFEAARAAYDRTVITSGAPGHRLGHHDAIIAAVTAAAPHLIAQGRHQAAAAIRAVDVQHVIHLDGDTTRIGLTIAARLAEGLSPAERAERQLRESRQRQAGLDMDRIERRASANPT